MLGINNLSTYILGAIGIVLIPGPNSIYCLTVASRYGIQAAYYTVAGILLGDCILMLLSALGAASLLKTIPVLFLSIKIIGSGYLAYLGWQLLLRAWQKWQTVTFSLAASSPAHLIAQKNKQIVSLFNFFKHALLLSLSNPKAILFFMAFFIQFINPAYTHPILSFFLLAVILQIISISYLSILIWSGRRLVIWFSCYRRMAAIGMGCIGLLFIGFAVQLCGVAVK